LNQGYEGATGRGAAEGEIRKRARASFVVLLGVLIAAAVGPVASAQGSALAHHFETYFGESLENPEALAVDEATGDVYIIETNTGCVSRYHGSQGPEALTADEFPATGTNKLCGFAYDRPSGAQVAVDNSGTSTDGTIYVTSPFGGGIHEYDREGNFITTLPSEGGAEQCGVAVDGEGDVMDGTYYGGLEEFKHDDPVESNDYVHTTYQGPVCEVAFDGLEGNRYASFWYNGPLVKTPTGEFYGFVMNEESTAPYGDPVNNDLYVDEGQTIAGFSEGGQLFERFSAASTESRGVAIDHQTGALYASDTPKGRIAVFKGEPVYQLSVSVSGSGFGRADADSGEISHCGEEGLCSSYYPQNGTVVLTATPQPHSVAGAWNGCDSVSGGECTVTLTGDREVSISFDRFHHPLTVSVAGTGTGYVSDANPGGQIRECGEGGTCTGQYDEGTLATLLPVPTGHSSFTGWSGDCSNSSGPCEVTVDAATSVTAHFTAEHAIGIEKAGTGAGSVESEPAGVNCGGTCLDYFTDGETIRLIPLASGHSSFTGWSGEVCSGMGPCEVPVGGSTKTVTANFAHDPPSATTDPVVSYVGQHAGTVHGSVDPNGAEVNRCVVEYGTTTAYGAQAPCAPSGIGQGTSPVPIGANLTELAPGKTYHFRISASNVGGSATGADQAFTTLADTCDTNAALCPPPRSSQPATVTCRKGFVRHGSRCVRRRHRNLHRDGHRRGHRHRHRSLGGSR
jgi:uncharacterized repeat protein (TIGR02543 family)